MQQTLTVAALSAPGSMPFSITFTGLGGQEFATDADFRAWALSMVMDPSAMQKLLVLWYLGLDPLLANPSILLTATLTYDDTQGGFTIQVGV